MKKNDRVKVKAGHKRAGLIGTIIESAKGDVNVYWENDEVFWISTKSLELIDETR